MKLFIEGGKRLFIKGRDCLLSVHQERRPFTVFRWEGGGLFVEGGRLLKREAIHTLLREGGGHLSREEAICHLSKEGMSHLSRGEAIHHLLREGGGAVHRGRRLFAIC